MYKTANILFLTSLLILCSSHAAAESKRVYVYHLPQQVWDVRPGDTLSGIAAALLPSSRQQQQSLMQAIVEINPDAFINQNPNRLRANIRLVLPGDVQTYSVTPEDANTRIQHFSWGSIQKREQ